MQVSPGALGFWHGLERHGDRVALLCPTAQGHQDITYAELAALADDKKSGNSKISNRSTNSQYYNK